jgi:hypothetical protein
MHPDDPARVSRPFVQSRHRATRPAQFYPEHMLELWASATNRVQWEGRRP